MSSNLVPGRETHYYNTDHSKKTEIKAKWWSQSKDEMHVHVKGVVDQIREHQKYQYANYVRFARIYTNQPMVGLSGADFLRMDHNAGSMSWNVIKACVDTVSSKIGKNKPRPLYLVDDGDLLLQRKAQNLTNFMQAQFMTMGTGQGDDKSLYGVGRQGFVDGSVWGLGPTKFYKENGKVYAERTLPHEIVVDDIEGLYRQPRQLHQTKIVSREVLCDLFPRHADKIVAASSALKGGQHSRSAADVIDVTESWHLRSGQEAADGKRAITIENATLFVEDYPKDYFPFLFQRWNNALLGFIGTGICEELIGIQIEINKILRTIAKAQHLVAVPQVWLELMSKQATKKLNNEIGGVRYYTGRPPVFATPPAMSSEIYQHLENLYQKAFELVGISQLSAQSKKPAGLDSGKALREFQDIESERFALAQMRYEDFFMDAADIIKDMNRDLAKEGKDPIVQCRTGEGIERLTWSDVDIPDDRCAPRPYPTSFLPQTPAGKFQSVQELVQGGFFDQNEALELLDFPDIKAKTREKLAPREANRTIIERALFKGEYTVPEPYMDLDGLKPLAQTYYLRATIGGVPEERLEVLRQLMDDVMAAIEKRDAPAAGAMPPDPTMADPAMAGMDPNQPMAQPEALPVSDLLPAA